MIKELLEFDNLKFRNYFSKHLLKNLFKISKSKKNELCLKEINPNILDENSKKFYHLLMELFNYWGGKYNSPIFYYKYLFLKNNNKIPVEIKYINLPKKNDSSLHSSILRNDNELDIILGNVKKKRRFVIKKILDKNLNKILEGDSIFQNLDEYEKEFGQLKKNEKVQKVLKIENKNKMGKEKNEILNEIIFYDEFNQIFNDFIQNSNHDEFNEKLNNLYNRHFDLNLLNELSPQKNSKIYEIKSEKIIESKNFEIPEIKNENKLDLKNEIKLENLNKNNSKNIEKEKNKEEIFNFSQIEISKSKDNSFISGNEKDDFNYLNSIEDNVWVKTFEDNDLNPNIKNNIENYRNKIYIENNNDNKEIKNRENFFKKKEERFSEYKNHRGLNYDKKVLRDKISLDRLSHIETERKNILLGVPKNNYLKQKRNFLKKKILKEKILKEKNERIYISKKKSNVSGDKNKHNYSKSKNNFSKSKNKTKFDEEDNYSKSKNNFSKSKNKIIKNSKSNLTNMVNKKINDINDLELKIDKLENELYTNNILDSYLNFTNTTRDYKQERSGTEFVLAMNRDLEKLLINKRKK